MRRFFSILAAVALVLLVAAPAFAQDLHQTLPISWDDAASQGTADECANANLQPGQVLWHFVGNFASPADAVASFTFADGTTYTNLPPTDTAGPEAHWTIITGETSLTAASVTPDTSVDGFNLSHICSSPPTEVPEAPFSALLLLSGGLLTIGFVGLRMRRSHTLA